MKIEVKKSILGSFPPKIRIRPLCDIIENFNHYVSGFIDFNLVLNKEGGPSHTGKKKHALINVDSLNDIYYKNPSYYHVGHFSKFLDENFTVVRLVQNFGTASVREVHCLAAKNGENTETTVVIVCLNLSKIDHEVWFEVQSNFINTVLEGKSIRTIVVKL